VFGRKKFEFAEVMVILSLTVRVVDNRIPLNRNAVFLTVYRVILRAARLPILAFGVAAIVVVTYINIGIGEEARSGSREVTSKKLRSLTTEEHRVIVDRGTEAPFAGAYVYNKADGVYKCRQCGAQLFASGAKFDSGTGWPSFDSAIAGAVREIPDSDGTRTEIVCAACGGHLGHVFRGEGFTAQNTRHCVNSISLDFEEQGESNKKAGNLMHAYFAGGCFWGVEYHLEQVPGVNEAVSGYMGGAQENPSYEQVCYSDTGHAEAVRVTFDPGQVSYEQLAQLFFEIHDPTQVDRQGPDRGRQYRSAIFYADAEQQAIAEKLIERLRQKGYDVVTELQPLDRFYPAEEYHQDYYRKKRGRPYCHARVDRFGAD
jgi:peptide methionine sulfoxide reductase msrA/msrB